jgi:hypothetical protein
MEGIGDIESFSKAIPLPRHLATALEGQTADLERVHMVSSFFVMSKLWT